jgi:hypothetical protein
MSQEYSEENKHDYKNLDNLNSLHMNKGQMYETIITTKTANGLNSDDKVNKVPKNNAAPIGVLCKNPEQVVLYLYEGTHTLKNIDDYGEFIVNITQDPLIFTKSTLGDVDEDHFADYKGIPYFKNTDAFFVARVENTKEITRKNGFGSSKMSIITANVEEVVQFKDTMPLNRGIYAVVESLIHYTRLELADDQTRANYWQRIKEMNRVAQKVGSTQEKKALQEIIKNIKSNFKDLD